MSNPDEIDIKLDIDELRKCKLFMGVPMYGGNCTGVFAQSMNELCVLCAKNGIELNFFYLFNESLIQRARNYIADEFLRSDCTHLMFIDADIAFNPISVIQLLAIQISDPEKYNVIAAPYPKKAIAWPNVKDALKFDLVDPANPDQIAYFGGDFVLNFIPGTVSFELNKPVSVLETGTGFMMIPRVTLENWKLAYPEMEYKPDHLNLDAFNGSRMIHAFFHCDIDPVTSRYLSEDYFFCQKVIAMGGQIWVCPWMELHHIGSYTYKGSLAAIGLLHNKRDEAETITQTPKKKVNIQPKRVFGGRP